MAHAVGALSDNEIILFELEIEQQVGVGPARFRFQQIAQTRQAAVCESAPGRMSGEQALGIDLHRYIVFDPVLDMRARAAVGEAALAAASGDDRRPKTGSNRLRFWRRHQVLSTEPRLSCLRGIVLNGQSSNT